MKKKLLQFLPIFVGGLLIFPSLAFAAVYTQSDETHDFSGNTTFSATPGTLPDSYFDSLTVKIKNNGGTTCQVAVVIKLTFGGSDYQFGDSGPYIATTPTIPNDNTYRLTDYNFADDFNALRSSLDPDFGKVSQIKNIYIFQASTFGLGTSCGGLVSAGTTSAPSPWSGGNAPFLWANDGVFIGDLPLADNAIAFLAPTNGVSTTDFRNFAFTANLTSGWTSPEFYITVKYGAGNTTDFSDSTGNLPYLPGADYNRIPVPKSNLLGVASNYQAKACLYDGSDIEQFCTSTIGFSVRDGAITDYAGNSTGGSAISSCGATGFSIPPFSLFGVGDFPGIDFGNGLCRLAVFLFEPSEDGISSLHDFSENLHTKIPFSYAFDLIDIVNGVTNSDTSSFPGLSINFMGTDIDLFSADAMENAMGTTNYNLYRNLLTWSIWIGFGFYLYHRGRTLV